MSDLTIESGVYVNQDSSTTTRFTTITLSNAVSDQRDKGYPQGIQGIESLERPITFEWEGRFVREVMRDSLVPIAAKSILLPSTRNANGELVAVLGDGELCKFSWVERDRRDESTQTVSQWGYFTLDETSLQGRRERGRLTVYPADRVRFRNSSVYLSVEQDS